MAKLSVFSVPKFFSDFDILGSYIWEIIICSFPKQIFILQSGLRGFYKRLEIHWNILLGGGKGVRPIGTTIVSPPRIPFYIYFEHDTSISTILY